MTLTLSSLLSAPGGGPRTVATMASEGIGTSSSMCFQTSTSRSTDVREVGDLMLIAARISGRGKGSDVPVGQPIWQLGEIRGGRVIWWRSYPSEAQALEAAGLSE